MENFIVSARKYRPQTFETVVGQKSITSTLKNAIKHQQLAQAFLFCGPRGVGKTTCARILAKTINCENLSPTTEACDQCLSCKSFNDSASFNVYELDGASNNSVDDIRTLVDQVRIPPQMGKYKVYIIDEVHMLSASAFNAFLKTLEEPPAYTKFILATTEKHKIIPTILSRCQIFDFRRITVEDIAGHLQYVAENEHITIDDNARHVIAQKADGAMRDALTIFDQLVSFAGNVLTYDMVLENLNVLDYDYFFRITNQILAGDTASVLLTINEIIDKGFDGQHFLIGLGEHLRNLLVCKDVVTVKLLETAPSIRQQYLTQSARCSVSILLKLLDINNKCDLAYKISNNKRLHLEISLMQMCVLILSSEQVKAPVQENSQASQIPVSQPLSKPIPVTEAMTAKVQPVSNPSVTEKKEPEVRKMRDLKEKEPFPPGVNDDPGQSNDLSQEKLPDLPFSSDDLSVAWDEFAENIRDKYPHISGILKNSRPNLQDKSLVLCVLDNKLSEDEFNTRKTEMLDFLRKRLKNYQITIETRIEESVSAKKPYTDREKYEKMAEKNPNLKIFREQMDLEIEY